MSTFMSTLMIVPIARAPLSVALGTAHERPRCSDRRARDILPFGV